MHLMTSRAAYSHCASDSCRAAQLEVRWSLHKFSFKQIFTNFPNETPECSTTPRDDAIVAKSSKCADKYS